MTEVEISDEIKFKELEKQYQLLLRAYLELTAMLKNEGVQLSSRALQLEDMVLKKFAKTEPSPAQ